jgi:hypothetical protein
MSEQEYHEMVLDTVLPTGAEEWYCPTCGRRFLMQWPPTYSKVILEAGDESAIHSGGKGGVSIRSAQMTRPEEPEITQLEQVEEESLEPYIEWLGKVDFEALWNRETGVES